MRRLNKKFLQHDYATDVISFPLNDGREVSGEIYVGLDQARRQATKYGVSQKKEIHRLVIHGLLHLLGYGDDTPQKKNIMTLLEDYFLEWINLSS